MVVVRLLGPGGSVEVKRDAPEIARLRDLSASGALAACDVLCTPAPSLLPLPPLVSVSERMPLSNAPQLSLPSFWFFGGSYGPL